MKEGSFWTSDTDSHWLTVWHEQGMKSNPQKNKKMNGTCRESERLQIVFPHLYLKCFLVRQSEVRTERLAGSFSHITIWQEFRPSAATRSAKHTETFELHSSLDASRSRFLVSQKARGAGGRRGGLVINPVTHSATYSGFFRVLVVAETHRHNPFVKRGS